MKAGIVICLNILILFIPLDFTFTVGIADKDDVTWHREWQKGFVEYNSLGIKDTM